MSRIRRFHLLYPGRDGFFGLFVLALDTFDGEWSFVVTVLGFGFGLEVRP